MEYLGILIRNYGIWKFLKELCYFEILEGYFNNLIFLDEILIFSINKRKFQ
jgi:hypothetical protein